MRPPKSECMRLVLRPVPTQAPHFTLIPRTQPVAIGILREEKRSSSLMGTQQLASWWQEGPISSGLVRKEVLVTLPSLGKRGHSR